MVIIVDRTFANCTFGGINIAGTGLSKINTINTSSQGNDPHFNYLSIFSLDVIPGGNLKITTAETNLGITSGTYTSYVYAIY